LKTFEGLEVEPESLGKYPERFLKTLVDPGEALA
jgi:hypothetical protein